MKKIFLFLSLIAFLTACQEEPKQPKTAWLNGYWEITQVKQKNGNEIQFKMNETVDYIELKEDLTGFQKKLKPQLDGTYKKMGSVENLAIKKENDTLYMYYTTPMAKWKLTLLDIKKDQFTIKNEQGVTYQYSRFKRLTKNQGDGEE